MKKIKKQLAIAVTVALLAFPLGSGIALADAENQSTTTTQEAETSPTLDADATATLDTTTPTDSTTESDTSLKVVDAKGKPVISDDENWLENLISKLKEILTFSPESKVELNERQALEKLSEAQKLMQEGKAEAAEISLNHYTDKVAKAVEFLDEVDSESDKYDTLAKALASVNSNNIQVLGNLLDKVPDQAAEKISLNIVRSMEKAIEKMEKREAKVAEQTETSETTPVIDEESLEKHKTALENFKKSQKQKDKILDKDLAQQDTDSNDVAVDDDAVEPNHGTVVSETAKANVKAQTQHINTGSSEQGKEDKSRNEVRGNDDKGNEKNK